MARKSPTPKKSPAKRAKTKKKSPKHSAPKKSALKRTTTKKRAPKKPVKTRAGRPSSLLDTRIIHCGDCLDQLRKLPDGCVDLIYIDPPFNSNRNYEVFWGETKEKRAFKDRHASTQAYIDYMRPRRVELPRVLKKTGSFHSRSIVGRPTRSCGTRVDRKRLVIEYLYGYLELRQGALFHG